MCQHYARNKSIQTISKQYKAILAISLGLYCFGSQLAQFCIIGVSECLGSLPVDIVRQGDAAGRDQHD
jgi:hypothetical protein